MDNKNEIKEVKKEVERNLINKANVVAVGIGKKNKTGEEGITVYVSKKKDPKELSTHDAIPKVINGVKTDVVEIGEIRAHTHKIIRPVYGGISAIHHTGTACTLGAIVYKDDKVYGLTNVHCGFPHWEGAKLGDAVIQPSPFDGGKPTDIIGHTKEAVPLKFDGSFNEFDACLVELTVEEKELYQETIGKHKKEPSTVKIGDAVQKTGRTTGFQKSKVIATDVTASVTYDEGLVATFKNQIFCDNKNEYFSAGGDSGSLVLNMEGNPVGLNYAGSNVIEIMNPILPILNYYGVTFDKKPMPPKPPSKIEGYIALQKNDGKIVNYVDFDPKTIKKGVRGDTNFSLSFRKKAGINEDRVRVLPPGTQFEIIGTIVEKEGYIWGKIRVK